MENEKSCEQIVRDILDAAVAAGLVVLMQDHHGTAQDMSSGDLVGPANVLEQYIEQRLAGSREPGGDAKQAAERAVEIARQFTVELDSSDEDEHEFVATAFLNDLIAPLLAAKDEEIERITKLANARLCESCLERHAINVMCPPHEARTTGQQWFRERLSEIASDRDRLAAHLKQSAEDWCETDAEIRKSAKRVLPAAQVDGDRTCVPPIEEVVELLVAEVAELRKVLENCRPFLAVYVNLKQQIDAALAAKT